MPAPRKVDVLPSEIRDELNRRIVEGGFGGYVELSDWLAGQGFSIGKSVLAEHGGRLRHRIEALKVATEQAEALVSSTQDDQNALADASLRMVQEMLFEVLLAGQEGDPKTLAGVARALADVARASERIRETRRKVLAEKKAEAKASLDAAERDAAAGSDPMDLVRRVREEIYGIFDA